MTHVSDESKIAKY